MEMQKVYLVYDIAEGAPERCIGVYGTLSAARDNLLSYLMEGVDLPWAELAEDAGLTVEKFQEAIREGSYYDDILEVYVRRETVQY